MTFRPQGSSSVTELSVVTDKDTALEHELYHILSPLLHAQFQLCSYHRRRQCTYLLVIVPQENGPLLLHAYWQKT